MIRTVTQQVKSVSSCGQMDLRTSESTSCDGNTTFVEVVTFAVRSVADGLKVDSEQQLSTYWVQIHRQGDACR